MRGESESECLNVLALQRDLEQCVPLSVAQGKHLVDEVLRLRDELKIANRENIALISETADMVDQIAKLQSRVKLQGIALRSHMNRPEPETALTEICAES